MDKAKIYEKDKESEAFTVQFNPNSLQYSISSNKDSIKGTCSKMSDGVAGQAHAQNDPTGRFGNAVLSVRLFYHTYYNRTIYTDVRDEIKKLRNFVRVPAEKSNQNTKVPQITFAWGSLIHTGELDDLSITYQMFAADGTPVQAEVSLSICGKDADWTIEKTNQLYDIKKKFEKLDDNNLENSLLEQWAWMFS